MTPTEAVLLTRYVEACCPQQRFDEYTPDAWFDLLGDLDFDDCKEAAKSVARRQPFVAPAEIRAQVREMREERIALAPLPPPDPEVPEAQYRDALKAIVRRAGDGRMPFRAIPAGGGAEPTQEYQANRSDEDRDRVLAQSVDCPVEWCTARASEPCVIKGLDKPMRVGHPERLEAARSVAEGLGDGS